jgi:hypothetical protein
LCSVYLGKTLYAYSVRKSILMTQSYMTPLTYDLIRESDTFDEVEDVQSSEVVLLSYANDNFYLDVPHKSDKETGEYLEQNLTFKNWKDYQDVDFNGWFMVEASGEDENGNKRVHLKHFNTGKYMTIINGEGVEGDYAVLKDQHTKESEMIFEPVNMEQKDVLYYTTETVFKIRASHVGNDMEKNYLRFANEDDIKTITGDNKQKIFEESSNETTPLVVKDACPINKFDTFNLVFPKDDTYRELVFCKDAYLHLKLLLERLEKSKDGLETLEEISDALFKLYLKIFKFLNNNLEGLINSDYDIDEIVEYRQELVAKARILTLTFDFLEHISSLQKDHDMSDEDWAKELLMIFKLTKSESNDMDSVLELIFETLYTLFNKNSDNQFIASRKIDLLQEYVFVNNMTKVLIAIFRDKQFEMNKKEIHTEILYRRIYEYERFIHIARSFVQKLIDTGAHKYIYILRKICVIDGNPLPLIQKEIFEELYTKGENAMHNISYSAEGTMLLHRVDDPDDDENIINVRDFEGEFTDEAQENFVLEQLALEADLCFGRNKYCTPFFKERYPAHSLIVNIIDESIPKSFRACLIRILTSIYIDDHPHSLIKMSRCFKAYQSAEEYLGDTNFQRSEDLTPENLNLLFNFIRNYFYAFAKTARGPSYVRAFEMELVK